MHQDLLARFRAGDQKAVGDLYSTYGGAVHTVAMSILHNREMAADATQQTFVKAWQSASSFDPHREFGPWIYAIARNTAIDVLRAETRRESLSASGDVDSTHLPAGIESAWEAFEVRPALDQLPEHYARALELKYVEGYDSKEIAKILERSDEAIQSLLARARRAFKEVCSEVLTRLYGDEQPLASPK